MEINYSKNIKFINNSDLPIMVQSWHKMSDYVNRTVDILVNPFTTINVYSETGEWHLHKMFNDNNWELFTCKNPELKKIDYLGSFHTWPNKLNKNTSIESDYFSLNYDSNDINVIFSKTDMDSVEILNK